MIDVPYFPDAACRSVGHDPFYADETHRADNTAAKKICAGCPERLPCATWAITTLEPYGIWGGMTARERQQLRRTMPVRTDRASAARAAAGAVRGSDRQERAVRARQLAQQGHTPTAIAAALNVHARSIHRYLKDTA